MYTPSRTQGQSTLVVLATVPWNLGVWTLEALKEHTNPVWLTAPLLQGGVWVGCVRLVGFKGWGVILWEWKRVAELVAPSEERGTLM